MSISNVYFEKKNNWIKKNIVRSTDLSLLSCDQAALWMVFSVCLSVRLSVCPSHLFDYVPIIVSVCLSVRHTFLIMFPSSYHHEIFRVITKDPCNVHAKGQGQRSKVKVTEVTTQLSRFRTVTPVWIHLWWWNDTYSLMLLRRGALLPDCNSSLNSPMATKCCTKLEVAMKRCSIVFQGHPSNYNVARLLKSSNLTQIGRFRTVTPIWIHQWVRNDSQSLK